MMWLPPAPLLPALLLLLLLLCPAKLKLAWKILRTKTDLGLFNTVLALCLAVSGEMSTLALT